MKVIGLTGGMGSGKSAVALAFQKHGVPTLDADHVARGLREPGKVGHAAIFSRFNTTDRAELRRIITESPEAKKALEAILHPLIKSESDRLIEELKVSHPHAPFILYEATLLIEAGRVNDFDSIIVVTAPMTIRATRVAKRDKISEEDALKMIQIQSPDEFRLPFADFVIENSGDPALLEDNVRKVLDQIIST